MLYQLAVLIVEIALAARKLVRRSGAAIGLPVAGHAAQPEERIPQPTLECQVRFARADSHGLPVRVGQYRVLKHVLERPAGYRDG